MNRTTNVLAGFLLALAPLAFSQDPQLSNPQVPEDAFETRQLIAWSNMQKPQPAPQPLPPRDTPIPQPDQQQDQQSKPPADTKSDSKNDQSPASANDQTPAAQSFTGKIVRTGDTYVLKVTGDTTYQLDEQDQAKRYEDQNVKVTGNLDAGAKTIHVVKIELLS